MYLKISISAKLYLTEAVCSPGQQRFLDQKSESPLNSDSLFPEPPQEVMNSANSRFIFELSIRHRAFYRFFFVGVLGAIEI